jgi:hypothetical protein
LKKFLFSALLFSLFLSGCKTNPPPLTKIRIENKLHKNIVCILGYNYPDLSFKFTSKQALVDNNSWFEIDSGQTKAIDTLGLCKKNVWDNYVKKSLLIVFIFDKDKFATSDKLEDALIETQYYTYAQLMATNGIISIDYRRTD